MLKFFGCAWGGIVTNVKQKKCYHEHSRRPIYFVWNAFENALVLKDKIVYQFYFKHKQSATVIIKKMVFQTAYLVISKLNMLQFT